MFFSMSRPGVVQAPKEYQVKAAFLFNFTRFVEWPADVFDAPDSPFVLGVVGKNPFGTYLEEIIKGESINGHPLELRYFKTSADITGCHILYIAQENKEEMKQAVTQAAALSALTVSDNSTFTRQGGMIRFVTEDNKTRIRINLSAVRAEGLTISSKLLKLAEIVEPDSN